tara:strand:- start:138 stop:341 length:204 start_codon:yes stop_codon:yes gene_type:complete
MIDAILAIISFIICIAIVVVVCVGLFYGRRDLIQERVDLEIRRRQEAIEARRRSRKAKMKRRKNNPA